MTFALLIMVGLGALAYLHPAMLGPIANPANTEFIARPDWYYLPFFEWLKFFEGPTVVLAIVVVPGILALLFFLMPFLDRSLERRPWRRPIPVLSVAIVLAGILFLGFRSNMDDKRDPSVSAQLAVQEQQEKVYSAAPFIPFQESPGGASLAVVAGPANPLVAQGISIFAAHGCAGCHGAGGVGGIAPTLVGITTKYPGDQLDNLLLHPNAAMNAGHMPAVDVSAPDLKALTAYLGALGTPTANAPAAESTAAAPVPTASGYEATGSTAAASAPAAVGKTIADEPTAGATAAGQQLFDQRGCAACHGAAGAGGRVAAMSTLIAGQPNAHVLQLIQAPNAKMKAGGMQAVTGSPAELTSVVAYLKTLGAAPAAAAPAAGAVAAAPAPSQPAASATAHATAPATAAAPPSSEAPAPVAVAAMAPKPNAGHAVFVSQGCAACHGPNAGGTHFAPALIGVAAKFPGEALPNLLHHPSAKMKAGGMPPVTANPTELAQLVGYITSLDLVPAPAATPAPSVAANGAGQPAPANAAAPKTAAPKTGNSNVPPQTVAALAPPSPLAVHGGQVFQRFSCETCHGAGGLHGTAAAPGLAGSASMLPAETLNNLLRHHSTQMINGNMPPTNMNAQDMKAVIAYIRAMPSTPETP